MAQGEALARTFGVRARFVEAYVRFGSVELWWKKEEEG